MESPQGIEEEQQEEAPLYEEEDLIEASNFIQSLDLDPKAFTSQTETLAKVFYERRKLKEKNEKLEELTVYDPLTKLLNRRGFIRALNAQLAELKRLNASGTLLIFDMDNFKSLNDKYGHGRGDKGLVDMAEALKESIREGDIIGRIGGDEFAVLLTGTPSNQCTPAVIRIQEAYKNKTLKSDYSELSNELTLSGGVCQTDNYSTGEILEKADAALYHAKQTKNTVSVYNPDRTITPLNIPPTPPSA